MKNGKHEIVMLVAVTVIITALSVLLYQRFLTTLSIADGFIWVVNASLLLLIFLTAGAIDEFISAGKDLQKVSDDYIQTLTKGYNEYRDLLYTLNPELKPPEIDA